MMTWSVGYGQERRNDAEVPAEEATVAGEAAATGQLYKASDLIGMSVQGENEAELGEVRDLLINSETQEVQFLLLHNGGFAGLGGTTTVIPWIIAETHTGPTADEKYISLALTEERLKSAPQMDVSDVAELTSDATWVTQVNEFFATEIRQHRVARPDLQEDEARPGRQGQQRNPNRPRTPRTPDRTQPEQPEQPKPEQP
jgi:sporulation protein YlmC with PRC-barrel domain